MAATKLDLKRELHELYAPGDVPCLIDVPDMAFLMIDGHGDPNTADEYRQAIEALYAVSYTAKFALKRAPDGVDFTVMPLEGLWWASDMSSFAARDKSAWSWTAMIMQPEAVTADVVADAREAAAARKTLPALERMRFETFREGLSAQVMHHGPYADEAPTIARLHEFIAAEGYVLSGKHHEIYLGDPRRTKPERLRTVIRQPVAAA
jgi:hypothetical protein